MKTTTRHGHGKLVGIGGLALGLAVLLVFPRLRGVGGAVALVALFHLMGGAIVFGALTSLLSRRRRVDDRPSGRSPADARFDFGWSRNAYRGPFLAAAALLTTALGLQLHWPALWPAWFVVALAGVNCFIGGLLLRSSERADHVSLPLVDFLQSDDDLVLDAGCGGGRTTLAVAKVLRRGRIVAFDRFDAEYIDGGGRASIERNLWIAGLTERVDVVAGDFTQLPFPENHFDTVVSAHAVDHLGARTQAGLAEIRRVLKPGGRFLMVVWVPGWATFTLGNVFSFLLKTPAAWRRLAGEAGFTLRDQGHFNGWWFAVLERPGEPAPSA